MSLADNINQGLAGMPLDYLISAPLTAACDANKRLANAMVDFVNTIAYNKPNDPKSGVRYLDFELEKPVKDETTGNIYKEKFNVKPPLLGLLTIPSLLVDEVNIDFSFTMTETKEDNTKAKVEVGVSGGWGPVRFSAKSSVENERKRKSDYSSTYKVIVIAKQQEMTETMNKLYDLFAQCCEPITA